MIVTGAYFSLFFLLINLNGKALVDCQNGDRILFVEPVLGAQSAGASSSQATDEQGSFSSHIVALRPDYTFWRMVNVLKTMFEPRATTEKRRPSRGRRPKKSDDDGEMMILRKCVVGFPELVAPDTTTSHQQHHNVKLHRLFLNFGRFRLRK